MNQQQVCTIESGRGKQRRTLFKYTGLFNNSVILQTGGKRSEKDQARCSDCK